MSRRSLAWAALLAAIGPGCARDVPRPRPATLGTDFSTVPPGRTIPPPSLGVDLVRVPAARPDDRPGVARDLEVLG